MRKAVIYKSWRHHGCWQTGVMANCNAQAGRSLMAQCIMGNFRNKNAGHVNTTVPLRCIIFFPIMHGRYFKLYHCFCFFYECNLCSELGKGVFVCLFVFFQYYIFVSIHQWKKYLIFWIQYNIFVSIHQWKKYLIFWIKRSRRNIRTRIWARIRIRRITRGRIMQEESEQKIRRIRTRITRNNNKNQRKNQN